MEMKEIVETRIEEHRAGKIDDNELLSLFNEFELDRECEDLIHEYARHYDDGGHIPTSLEKWVMTYLGI